MSDHFEGIADPTQKQIDALSAITPSTPFNTSQYANACTKVGQKPCILSQCTDSRIVSGCLGILTKGFLYRRLEIVTAPNPPNPTIFWNGVWRFCKDLGVWDLDIESYGSEPTKIPSVPGESSRRKRYENILDLKSSSFLNNLSSNHRYNIKRAGKAGLMVRRTREALACKKHLQLMHLSRERRVSRGEEVLISSDTTFFEALLASGAGEFFQTFKGEEMLSSLLIVRSSQSAYAYSAGNSPEGMNLGASAFLFSEIARILKEEGVQVFNLGGGDPAIEGLRRFKAGFGGQEVMLEAATFFMVSPVKLRLRKAISLLCRDPGRLLKSAKSILTRV